MKYLSPITKIIITIIIAAGFLCLTVIYFWITTDKCYQYSTRVLIGRMYGANESIEMPNELVAFFKDYTMPICGECCYYPKKETKITRYFINNNTKSLDSITQKIVLYNKKLDKKTRAYDLPEIGKKLSSIELDNNFLNNGDINSRTFKSKVLQIVNRNPGIKILFFSTVYSDTNLIYEINDKSYKIFTNLEELLNEKFRYFSISTSNDKSLDNKKILLIFNPIYEKKYINITNTESTQIVRDGSKNREIQFLCNNPSPDSIIWRISNVVNVRIAVDRGMDMFRSRVLHLIDIANSGLVEIIARPFLRGYISSDFTYRITVSPIPPPLPNIEGFIFDQKSFKIRWRSVDGARRYDMWLRTGNTEIRRLTTTEVSYNLERTDVRRIINSNGRFGVKLIAKNSHTSSPIKDTIFNLNMEMFFQIPSIDKNSSNNTDTFKWKGNNPYEEYIVELSKSTGCDECVIIDSQTVTNNNFEIKQGMLPSGVQSENSIGTMYVYYFRIKSKLFDQTTNWSKPVMFQWVDGKILLCN